MKFYQGSQSGTVLKNGVGSINEMASHIKAVAQGRDCAVDMSWMVEFASATLEKELAEGFINGDLRKSVTISLTEHNKKLFLGRAFRQQGVRCVFVPDLIVIGLSARMMRRTDCSSNAGELPKANVLTAATPPFWLMKRRPSVSPTFRLPTLRWNSRARSSLLREVGRPKMLNLGVD
ncbi:hypothetical protein AP1_0438 [Aeromonas phage AP1]|nr:hypothetical protein AP1_0438 [Aeromonas phage AP1]